MSAAVEHWRRMASCNCLVPSLMPRRLKVRVGTQGEFQDRQFSQVGWPVSIKYLSVRYSQPNTDIPLKFCQTLTKVDDRSLDWSAMYALTWAHSKSNAGWSMHHVRLMISDAQPPALGQTPD